MPSQLTIEPPSALPSFIESSSMSASSDANTSTTASAPGPTTDPGTSTAPVAGNPAASAFYPKTFR